MKKLSIQAFELAKASIAEEFHQLTIDVPYEESAKVIDKKMELMLLAQEMYLSEEEEVSSGEMTKEVENDQLEKGSHPELSQNLNTLSKKQEEEIASKKKESEVKKSEEKLKSEGEDKYIEKRLDKHIWDSDLVDDNVFSSGLDDTESKENFTQPIKYEFTRNLRGGHLNEIQAHVPESVVRLLNIEHGDLLYAYKQKNQPKNSGITYYDFELAEKNNNIGERVGRKQYNLCPVELKEQRLVIHTSVESGPIISNNKEVVIELAEEDIHSFKIKDGDLIDVAFYEDSLSRVQVIWRHKIEARPEIHPLESSNRTHRKARNNENSSNNETQAHEKQELKGISIVVIGEAHDKQNYRMQVERQGGTLFMLDGKDSTLKIRQNVAKADLIMCVIGTCSHNGMELSRDEAKKQGKPFIPVFTNSAATLVKMAIENIPNIKA